MPEVSTVPSSQDDLVKDSARDLSSADAHASPANFHNGPGQTKQVQIHDTPRLVQDTSGRSYYIGPSGSLSFFAKLRELVSERHPSSRFASDNVAEALEARSERSPHPTAETNQPVTSNPAATLSCEALRSASCLRNLPLGTLDELLRLYFDNVHVDFPLFHRAMFQDEFERYFLSKSRSQSCVNSQAERTDNEPDDGWLVCLHMMVAFGCVLQRALPGHDRSTETSTYETLQSECWNMSRAALPRLTTMCVQSHVQALLLIALYLHGINERNASWILAGCAARIAVAIGLHRKELHGSFPLIERETRKRIWCTLYGFEQFLCLSLGRPPAVDDDEVNASPPSDDVMSSNGPPGYTEWNFQLQLLASKLRRTMSVQYQPTRLGTAQKMTPKAILNDLKAWEDSLPAHLVLPEVLLEQPVPSEPQLRQYCSQYPVHHLRSIILLHIQYHSLVILATRPYLLMIISASQAAMPYPWDDVDVATNEITHLARSCVFSASRLATLILILDRFHILNGLTWLDVFYAYSAAMVLLLRILWIPHPSASREDLDKEKAMKGHANALVREVWLVLKSVTKSSTMQRFASVVENFADAVTASTTGSRRRDQESTGRARPALRENPVRVERTKKARSRLHHQRQERSSIRVGRSPNFTGTVNAETDTNASMSTYNISGDIAPYIGHTDNFPYLPGDSHYNHRNHNPNQNTGESVADSTADSRATLPMDDSAVQFDYNRTAYDVPDDKDALTEAAQVISSFSDEALSACSSPLWNDPLQSVTQHIADWNDFERFLGGLEEG
ncbi:hypothetical protein VTN77DRAFT_8896 [Rasamsonia byssochlamydoides]|uniref:uncharacterized protein n=1 Tax=Rasamsonia byssochlamydoides TaxID=89139 RepID=UPI0037436A1D